MICMRPGQQVANLAVTGLTEIAIKIADRGERRRRVEADDIIHHGGQLAHGIPCGHRNRDHGLSGSQCLHGLRGGSHRRPGCHAVVHQYDVPILEGGKRPVTTIKTLAPVELRQFALGNLGNGLFIERRPHVDEIFIQDANPAKGDGTDRKFRLHRGAEFTDDDDIQLRIERPRNLPGNGHPATRQREDNRPIQLTLSYCLRQSATGISPVREDYDIETPI